MQKQCEVCAVTFNAAKSRIRTCSNVCGGVLRQRPAAMVERACDGCGLIYLANATRLSHGRETTCSRECSYKVRGQLKEKPRTAFECPVCGDEFSRSPAQIKAKHGAHFCSRGCHFAGRALGIYKPNEYQRTREGMAAQRQAGARAYASGESIQWPEIENTIAALLRDAGHVVIQQHIVSDGEHFWPVDIFVPALLTIVEIDGAEHWLQRNKRERDAMVDAQCERDGLRVIRIPDGAPSDVRKAVLRALAG